MDSFKELEEKIVRAVTFIDKLTEENKLLADENSALKNKLTEYGDRLAEMEKTDSDRSEKVKDKLNGLIGKLNLLEQI